MTDVPTAAKLNTDRTTPSRRFILMAAGTAAASAGLVGSALADGIAGLGAAPLTAATFTPLIGTYFLLADGDSRTQLRLTDVLALPAGKRPETMPDPFSLLFDSPWHETLSAQIYQVENAAIGRVSMFITPVSKNLYEAPFN